MLRLALLFVILIAYGSLYPFDVWTQPAPPLFHFLGVWPATIDRADLVQNVLAYAPFGLFFCLWRLGRDAVASAIARTAAAGLVLSAVMESLQQFEPARTASTADIAMNVLGALAGAVLALVFGRAASHPVHPGQHGLHPLRAVAALQRWRDRRFASGTLPNIGLAALGLWALSQTSPLVPAPDPAYLARNLASLGWELRHPLRMGLSGAVVVAFQLTGLGLLLRSLVQQRYLPAPGGRSAGAEGRLFISLLALVFSTKLIVYGRMLGLSDVLGAALALGLLHLVRAASARTVAQAGGAALLCGFVLNELLASPGGFLHDFNWVPLAGQMRSLAGLENILELFWPFFALAYFVRVLTPLARRAMVSSMGGVLVLALVFWLEWHQQDVPGRFGDITQVLLALGGWLLPWSFRSADFRFSHAGARVPEHRPAGVNSAAARLPH